MVYRLTQYSVPTQESGQITNRSRARSFSNFVPDSIKPHTLPFVLSQTCEMLSSFSKASHGTRYQTRKKSFLVPPASLAIARRGLDTAYEAATASVQSTTDGTDGSRATGTSISDFDLHKTLESVVNDDTFVSRDFHMMKPDVEGAIRLDRAEDDPRKRVWWMIGDSHFDWSRIQGMCRCLQVLFPDVDIVNKAHQGWGTQELLYAIMLECMQPVKCHPELILVSVMANNACGNRPWVQAAVEESKSQLREIFRLLQARHPNSTIVYFSPSIGWVRWKRFWRGGDDMLREYLDAGVRIAMESGVEVVDQYSPLAEVVNIPELDWRAKLRRARGFFQNDDPARVVGAHLNANGAKVLMPTVKETLDKILVVHRAKQMQQ